MQLLAAVQPLSTTSKPASDIGIRIPNRADFLKHIFPRIEWAGLLEGARALNCATGLPEAANAEMLEDEDFLKAFHHALLEVHLEEGALICPETGRRFPVNKGIPNLLLNEDEC